MSLERGFCVLLLLVLSALCARVAVSDGPVPPDGKRCKAVKGEPGCVCEHPDGTINLTSSANDNGKPKYVLKKFVCNTISIEMRFCAGRHPMMDRLDIAID